MIGVSMSVFPFSLWQALREPRVVTAAMMAGYASLGVAGSVSMFHPPTTIETQIGELLAVLWAAFFALGGLVGVAATPRGVWWLERIALIAVSTGMAIYGSTVMAAQMSGTGSRWMQLGVIGWGLLGVVVRWHRIRWAALDPAEGLVGDLHRDS